VYSLLEEMQKLQAASAADVATATATATAGAGGQGNQTASGSISGQISGGSISGSGLQRTVCPTCGCCPTCGSYRTQTYPNTIYPNYGYVQTGTSIGTTGTTGTMGTGSHTYNK
jgi:hypothetical protein